MQTALIVERARRIGALASGESWGAFHGVPITITDSFDTAGLRTVSGLRAAVLGANDGIVSTASLVVGIAAAASSRHEILAARIAGVVAGALSMAAGAGEYLSVSSQGDTELADVKRERRQLATQPEAEEHELTGIYVRRGLERDLARRVARRLLAQDALTAHVRRRGAGPRHRVEVCWP